MPEKSTTNDTASSACCLQSTGKGGDDCGGGVGYATPLDAMKNGGREKLMYCTCVHNRKLSSDKHDYLATVDIDPASPTYQQVIHRLQFPAVNDEIHHFGWNACSSCHNTGTGTGQTAAATAERRYLIVLALHTNNIYIVDTKEASAPVLHKVIDGEVEVKSKWNATFPHTAHCLASGQIMVSCLGDGQEDATCTFLLINGKTFEIEGKWEKKSSDNNSNKKMPQFAYDFWYQPRHNVMISTEWGAPKFIKQGFNPADFKNPKAYGKNLNVWNWQTHELVKQIDLGDEGYTPLEIRFFHNPDRADGYVGTALCGIMYYFYKDDGGEYKADKMFQIPPKKIEGWLGGAVMDAVISDQVFSLDDRFMYISNFTHGDIRQYDVSEPRKPKLVGQLFIGGSVCQGEGVKVIEDAELHAQPERLVLKGRKVEGAPNMIQLSLDGKRLYVTTSLYTPWDAQFYPRLAKMGGVMLLVNVNTETGGLTVDPDFLVDFSKEPDGPVVAHEMRYPGGDCTSEIWL